MQLISLNGSPVSTSSRFPDGAFSFALSRLPQDAEAHVTWVFSDESELSALIQVSSELRERNPAMPQFLHMPYCPNARMDRVRGVEDVFTLKHFAQVINWLGFRAVYVRDPHSPVLPALIDRVVVEDVAPYIRTAASLCSDGSFLPMLFYPDHGALKRYDGMLTLPFGYGIKHRDWASHLLDGLAIACDPGYRGNNVLIVDDICSTGGTALKSARTLLEHGADSVFLYSTFLDPAFDHSRILDSGLIEHVYTTCILGDVISDKITVITTRDL